MHSDSGEVPIRKRRRRNRLNVFRSDDEEDIESVAEELPDDMSAFNELGIVPSLIYALKEMNYRQPTLIQRQAIPVILERQDVLASAQTGSGKTVAFCVPLLQLLIEDVSKQYPRALILAPTRELVSQISSDIDLMSHYIKLRNVTIYGGVPQKQQVQQLQLGADIIIATPGRLRDLIRQEIISLNHIAYVVVDEADMMMDMGFIEDIEFFLGLVQKPRQLLFFSATISSEISDLADQFLSSPVILRERSEVDKPSIESTIFFVDQADKIHLLTHILQNHHVEKVLIFVKTKRRVDDIRAELYKNGISALSIHGDKDQRQRERIMSTFEKSTQVFLIATDLASRGLDIDDITHVINYDISPEPEVYVHRIGRTGRAGRTGIAYNFVNIKERRFLRRIEKYIGFHIPEAKSYKFKSRVPYTRDDD